jgi:hypothetical protein
MSQYNNVYASSSVHGNPDEKDRVRAPAGNKPHHMSIPVDQVQGRASGAGGADGTRLAGITYCEDPKTGRKVVCFRPKSLVPFSGAAGGVSKKSDTGLYHTGSGQPARDPDTYTFASSQKDGDAAWYPTQVRPTHCPGFRAGKGVQWRAEGVPHNEGGTAHH